MKCNLAGIILAGGQSSRMGRNKALLPLPGSLSSSPTTFMAQQVSLLRSLCQEVVLVARDQGQAEQYLSHLSLEVRIIIDNECGVGPLMGVYSGLQAVQCTHALVTAVDMPFLRPELLQFLSEQAVEDEIVMPLVSGIPQVLLAIYPRSMLPLIEALLQAGKRGPRFLLEKAAVHYIDELQLRQVDPQLRSFVNVNTPAELAALSEQSDS